MTSKQFTRAVETIGWTLRHTATRLGLPHQRIQRWALGQYPVPDEVAHWLTALASAHRNTPTPKVD